MPQTLRRTVGRTIARGMPFRLWSALVLLAVCGSLAFGASLALAMRDFASWQLAVWFAGAAGAAWCVFIPATVRLSGESWRRCVHIALITMAAGEIVLISGAAFHLLLWLPGLAPAGPSLHIATVALSNIAMAAAFTMQFRNCAIAPWRPLVWWMLILNGAGALFFAAGQSLLIRS
jgi:hypothetical protein